MRVAALIAVAFFAANCSEDRAPPPVVPTNLSKFKAATKGADGRRLEPVVNPVFHVAISRFPGRGSPLTTATGQLTVVDKCLVLAAGGRTSLVALPQGSMIGRDVHGSLYALVGGFREPMDDRDVLMIGDNITFVGGTFFPGNLVQTPPARCPKSVTFANSKQFVTPD